MRTFLRVCRAGILVGVLAAMGCRNSAPKPGDVKDYPVRGAVVSVDEANGTVELNHEAVPGLMEAMTMSYPLADKAVATELHRGDRITATIETAADGVSDMKLKNVVVIAQARPDYVPKVQYHVPAEGDAAPDFTLLNQSGQKISLKQFRGKVLLVTFIYTRCTLTNFCLKMSRNFAEIDKALEKDSSLYAKTHLLSISFDPEYDTPTVLKSYGAAYTGRYTKETFAHWDFAAPSVDELPKVEQWFDVGVTPGENKGVLSHSLSTVVIGRDGKVAAFYPSGDWTVDEVLKAVRAAS